MLFRSLPRVCSLALAAGIFVSLGAAIGVNSNVSAQDAPAEDALDVDYPTGSNPEAHGDWLVRCTGEDGVATACEAFRSLFLTENEQRILHIAVGHGTEEDEAVAIIIAPLGVLLPEGMVVRIDDGWPAEFDYQSCGTDGCRVRAPLDAGMLDAMRSGSELRVVVAELTGRRVAIPVSLNGFTEAFEAAELPAPAN